MDPYTERAHLIAAFSKLFPAWLETDEKQPDWPVCMIRIPTMQPDGTMQSEQVTWHISPNDIHLFAHLEQTGRSTWDGHSTATKYERLSRLPMTLSIGGD